MRSAVLRCETAVTISIQIMKAFVAFPVAGSSEVEKARPPSALAGSFCSRARRARQVWMGEVPRFGKLEQEAGT
jgi:hypothetical protein